MLKGIGARKLLVSSGIAVFLLTLLSSVLLLNHYVWAIDATGLTLTVVSDDTSTAVSDSSTTNGTVPVTGGQITYRWGWTNVPGGGNTTFSQTLPIGVSWNTASVALGCAVSGSYLTSGETLTCTINNLTDIPGTTDKIATVRNLTGGQTITTKLVSGSQQSANVSLTTASTSQVLGLIARGSTTYMTDAKDPATGQVSGLQVPFSMGFYVPSNATDFVKGQETLGSSVSMSYTVTIPASAQLIGCGTAGQYQNDSNYSSMPSFGTGVGTGTARVGNSGTLSCVQSGTTVTITATGIDGRLTQMPTGSGYYLSRGYFALHGMHLWMPSSSFNSSTATNVTSTLNSYTLTSASGIETSSHKRLRPTP